MAITVFDGRSDSMREKAISRKVLGVGLSITALTGTALAAATGALPMQLQDFHGLFSGTSSSSVTLPSLNDSQMHSGAIFGLCTAYLNHVSGTTTTTAPTTTTTAPVVTAVVTPPPGVPEILAFLASVNNESITQFCTTVNPKHAELKLNDLSNSDDHAQKSDDSTTTTSAASTTSTTSTSTTVPGSTTTTTTVSKAGSNDQDGASVSTGGTANMSQSFKGSGNGNYSNFIRGGFSSDAKVNFNARTNGDSHTKSSDN